MERFELAQLYEQFRDGDEEIIMDGGMLYHMMEDAKADAENGDTLAKRLVMQLSLEQPFEELRANVLALLEPAHSEYKRELKSFSHIEDELYKRMSAYFSERGYKEREKGRFLRRDKNAIVGVGCVIEAVSLGDGCFTVSPQINAGRARLRRGKVKCIRVTDDMKAEKQDVPAEEFELFSALMRGCNDDVREMSVITPTWSVRLDEKGAVTAGEKTEYSRIAGSFEELWEGFSLAAEAACDTAEGKKPSERYLKLADELQGEGLKKYERSVRKKRVIGCFAGGLAFGIMLELAFILMARIEGDTLGSLAWKIFAFSSVAFSLAMLPFALAANRRERNRMLK